MRARRFLSGRSGRRRTVLLERLADHPLFELVFDEAWYLARHPDVLNSGLGAAQHFLSSGVLEWRNPSPYVDLRFVAEALPQDRRDGPNAVRSLLTSGLEAGAATSPYVDLDWFARQHAMSSASPLDRFARLVRDGRPGRLSPSPWIDLDWYAASRPELQQGGLDPFEYFLAVGRWLRRFPHPAWDEDRYLDLNDYVRSAVGSGKYTSGFEQFCATGWSEVVREAFAFPLRIAGRADEYAESSYLADNADVRAALAAGTVRSGLEHLMTAGHREVANGERRLKHPSPFSEASLRPTGLPATGDWLVLLNHYDVDGVVDPHLVAAMEAYRSAGADVVLITTSAAADDLDHLVTDVVTKSRNDDLRDFGSWHHALRLLGTERLRRYGRVILANDSTYFPVRPPDAFFARLRASSADVFAVTDSVSGGRYHLQSYFLALGPHAVKVLLPELARRVAEQAEATKLTLIQRFEVGLSEFAHGQGLTSEVLVGLADVDDLGPALSPPDLRPISRLAATVMNVTHHLWRTSLAMGSPFLKVELLRDNPIHADIDGWQDAVDGPCASGLIEAHLARMRR